jgi:DNA repair protein RadC/predicted transport protein
MRTTTFSQKAILSLLLFLVSSSLIYGQNAVNNATFTAQGATPLVYSETNPTNGLVETYSWGQGSDFRLATVTLGTETYFLDNDFTQINYNIVRVSGNGGVTGDRCSFFVLEDTDNFNYQSSFPGALNDCSMQEVLRDPIVTRGANDVFKNATATAQNIERIDVLYEAFEVPSTASLNQVGFIAPEKNGNSSYRAAPILAVDATTGEPTVFGPVIEINGATDFGIVTNAVEWSFLANNIDGTANPYRIGGSNEPVGISLITLADLGYSAGDTVYGISFFDNNVPFNADLLDVTDPSDFPNANGGGADINGGLGAIVTSLATISGHIYDDSNANGIQDAGEPDLVGVSVTVTDSNGVDQILLSDSSGDFSAFVSGGNTTVNIDENDPNVPNGAVLFEGSSNDGDVFNVTEGQNTSVGNFGFAILDSDNDGVPDSEDVCNGYDDSADFDGDGVPDGCDLDDDNDGILDEVECEIQPVQFQYSQSLSSSNEIVWSAVVNGNVETVTVTVATNPVYFIGSNGTVEPEGVTLTAGPDFPTIDAVDGVGLAGGEVVAESAITFTSTIPLESIRLPNLDNYDRDNNGAGIGDPTDAICFTIPGNWNNIVGDMAAYDITTGALTSNNQAGNAAANVSVGGASTQEFVFRGGFGSALLRGTPGGETNDADATFVAEAPFTVASLLYEDLTQNGVRDNIINSFSAAVLITTAVICPNSDGDTFPDYNDLDSDNDGCPDALEGGATNIKLEDVNENGSINVGTVSSPINGGVDANGVPVLADSGNGQTVGSSQDDTVIAAECSVNAINDDYSSTPIDGVLGGSVGNVFDNDEYLGDILTPSDFTITPSTNGPLTVNSDGTVDVLPGTPSGTYTVDYTICQNSTTITPPNCDTATVTVVVEDPVIGSITSDSQNEGDDLVHNVVLSNGSVNTEMYPFSLVNNTTEDNDYVTTPIFSNGVTLNAAGDMIIVPPGVTSFTITTPTISDSTLEDDEFYDISVGGMNATGTIRNDDATVVSIGDVTVTEGNDGTTVVAEFPVTLSAPSDTDTVVTFTVADGTGTLGDADYVAPTELTVTIPAGETSAVFPVTVNGDDVVESDEEFEVTITNTTNGTIDPAATTGTGTITNDDATVVSIGDVTVTEGDDGTTVVAEFPVTLSAPADTDTVVTFTVADGTGTVGDADYVAPTELTVTIPAGETSAVFPVTVNGDDVVESDEEFEVTIANTTNGTIDPAATTGTGTITNDDATVVSIGDVTVTEGNDGTTVVAEFPVTLSAPSDTDTVVTFTVADGTGTVGDADYVAPTELTVTIPAGETSAVFPVTVNGDDVVESDEEFEVTIANTTNGTIDPAATTGTGTITNDDATVVSIGDVTVTEGDDGTTVVAEFPVTLSAPSDTDTVVTFTVADGTGTVGDADYVAPTELTVTIPAGETSAVFPVTVNGDDVVESDEEFEVTIANTTNGTIDPAATTGTGTITNDDATVVSIGDVTVTEGNDGTTVVAEFPVTLSAPSDTDTVVTFTIADGTGTVGDADYVAPTELTVTIPAGETSAVFPVTVNGDDVVESDEEFEVTIANTTNGTIDPAATTGTGTITNDDATVVSIGDVTVTEGNDGTTVVANFPVTLSAPSDTDTVVTFTVADGTGTVGDADYVAPTELTVTIPAGETSAVFPVTVNGDDVVESDEEFEVTITNTTNGTIDPAATTGTGTIRNDDATVVSIGDVTVTEGNDGTTVVANFPVTLSAPSDTDTVVTFTVADGTGTVGDADYVAPTELTVTIPAGETSAVFPVTVNGDDVVESDEEFEVTITNTTNGTIDPAATTGTGTITNDDATVVSIGDVTVTEGNDGTTVVAELPVTLSAPSDTDTVVTFTVADGTGTVGDADYVAPTELTVTIPAGETSAVFPVTVNGDDVVESDEEFEVTITNTTNGTIDPAATTGTGTIRNDDATVVSIGDVTVTEGNDGTTVVAEFPVTLSAPADTDTVVTFTVADGTGTLGDADYVAPTELTVTIPAGETSAVFPVTVNGDDVVESDEEFEVTITNTTNGTIDPAATTGTGTITNDDSTTVTIEDVIVDEDAGTVTIPVTLSNPSDEDTVIEIVTTTGTAGEDDYEETIVTVTIPAGETTGEVVIPIEDDELDEDDEIFTVNGTVTSDNTANTDPSGTVTITDNDGPPTVTIEDVIVDEDAGTATIPVTLSNLSDEDTIIEIVTTTGTAGEDDYEETIVTVIIPAGETTGEVVIPIDDDELDEDDEIFTVNGTVTSDNTANTDPSGTVTITDNDGPPTVTIEDVIVDEDAGTATIPVTLSNLSDEDTIIEIVTTTGTAGEDDYEETIVTVIIPAGETTGEVVIPIEDDELDEDDEIFTVNGTVTSGNTDNDTAQGEITIVDNDDAPTVTIEDVIVDEDAGTATIPVTLSNPSDEDTVIEIVTTTGTAGEDDYVETIVTVTIPAGETEGEVIVPITEDTTDEEDEIFTVDGTVTSGNTDNDTAQGEITITDNDGPPTVTIEDVIVDEDAGTVTVPVTLSNPSDEDTVIEIVTTTGTAGEDDYEETIVTVIIPAGETTGEVVIPIEDDELDEGDEIFTVDGTVTSGNTDNDTAQGEITITDNDGPPTVTIEDVIVDEDAGTATIPVTLSNPSDEDTVIEIVTTTGTAGEDDYEETIVTVTIPAGETEGEVIVPITEDTTDEEDEIFTVDGTVTSGNTDNDTAQGEITIVDNDDAPTVTIEDVIVDEDAGTVTIPVTLSNPSDEDTVIEIVTTTGTAGEDDYVETIVTVTIPAGETTGEVVIPIEDDELDEDDEIFTVDGTVTSDNTENTDPSGTVTITDNDGPPTVTIEDVIVDEDAGTATIPVTLSNPSDEDTVIEIVTTTGTAGEDDYEETIVTVIIPAGETTGEVVIPIEDDELDEDDEIFTVNGTVTSGNTDNDTAQGEITIVDNDDAPTVTIEDVIVDEDAGTVTIPVTLSNPSDEDTVIEIVTTTGTAGEDDYEETIVTVIIPAGETTGEVVIPIEDDELDEDDEIFTVNGTVTSGNTDNDTAQGEITIVDNDDAPTVTIEDVIVDEDAGTVTIPVTLSNPSDEDTVIEIVTTTGTAGEDDYEETIVTVIIPAGETTGEVVIPIEDDEIDEDDEIFTVNGTVTSGNTDNDTAQGEITIVDNDDAPTVTIEDVIVDEDAGTVTIPVTLSNPSDEDTVIEIVTTTGTAGEDDYEETIVTVIIPAGETTGEVVIPIEDDELDEDDEIFTVNGTVTSGNTDNTDPSGTVTIVDNDITGNLDLSKSSEIVDLNENGVIDAGDQINYTLTVTNNGSVDLTDVVVSDEMIILEENTVALLIVGDSVVFTGVYTITQDDIDTGEVINIAFAEGVDPLGDIVVDQSDDPMDTTDTDGDGDGDGEDPTITLIDQLPSLNITKTASYQDFNADGFANAGDQIIYTFVVMNTGNVTLTDVQVDDPMVIVAGDPVTLLPGESANFTAVYIITEEDVANGEIVNVATAVALAPFGVEVIDVSDDPEDPTTDVDDPTVTVLSQTSGLIVNNGISIGQDGRNDSFRIQGLENFPDNTLTIFNRWGIEVYTAERYGVDGNEFRGLSNGRTTISQDDYLPVGTYYWILEYVNAVGDTVNESGYLYITR